MNKRRMKLLAVILFVVPTALGTGLLFSAPSVAAKPAFMDRYNRDPFAKTELRNKCTVCHIGSGGGERNEFGEAFEDTGFRITPKLRKQFPDLFVSEPPPSQTAQP
ncbi:MAG: hypothetical protein HY231_08470 [Acidobacteria bacterium]|nr:hypothetical protein [Acidobacteriota bacterium]